MRRIIVSTSIFLILSIFFGAVTSASAAGNTEYSTSAHQQELDNIFTFGELGYDEKIMVAPYDSVKILFSIPPTWQLQDGGKIILRYDLSYSSSPLESQPALGGALLVYFNDVILDTIYLDQAGPVTKELVIPANALQPLTKDGRYYIGIFFDASVNCSDKSINSNLVISAQSEVSFSYTDISPTTNLSDFPKPFYQPQSLVKRPTTIVIPDKPSIAEVQAALGVSAGLGSATSGGLETNLVLVSQLSEIMRNNNNLIFVGLPTQFPFLQNVILPVPINDGKLGVNGAKTDDGIVQMALSPWNSSAVIMFVSGNTELALTKASAIIGAERIVTSSRPDVVVVDNITTGDFAQPVSEASTFSDLGYGNVTLGDAGGQYVSYSFPASSEQATATGSYIDLVTSRSNLLNFDQTGISIILNGKIISSLVFKEDAEQITTTHIKLLPNYLRRGNNLLEIITDLSPRSGCYSKELQGNWVTISETSMIYAPALGQAASLEKSVDLKNFPDLFLAADNLSEVAFVLPHDDPASWNQASRIAYYLGQRGNVLITDLLAAYGDAVPEEILTQRNMIIIGRASKLPIMDKMKDVLPAPFSAGTDEALQPAMLVNYRLLPGVNVGYVQLFPSPWNSSRAILAVMGNSDQGVPMAGSSLTEQTLLAALQGNFAIIYGDQILTTDTRLGPSREGLAGQLPDAASVTITPSKDSVSPAENAKDKPEIQGRAGWILPSLIVIIILVVALVVFGLRNQLISKKITEKTTPENEEH